jgi:mevalonate kinase
MPAITATAPGKIILFGEHAVVYGRPAIAVPLAQVQARAVVSANPRAAPGSVQFQAPEVNLDASLEALPPDHPLRRAVELVGGALGLERLPALTLRITSSIPVASGLGSGAAVSVAVIRALAAFLGQPLPPEQVSALAFEVEKLHHGTPSGIDNTVITYALPVYFVRPAHRNAASAAPHPVVGDTGVPSPTAAAVGACRAWQADRAAVFDAVA